MITNQQIDTTALQKVEADVLGVWEDRLREKWSEDTRLDLFREAIAEKFDAFRYLLATNGQQPNQYRETIVSRNIDRVQTEVFLVADLFTEIRVLVELLEDESFIPAKSEDSADARFPGVRETLWDFYEVVARETSIIYETFAEQGSQGLVFLDRDGNVTYANRSARNLIGGMETGFGRFDSRLSSDDRQRFEAMLQHLDADSGGPAETMSIRLENEGEARDIRIEAVRLGQQSHYSAYYLSLSSGQFLGVEDDLLEEFDHGVIRLDSDRYIVYANNAARRIFGIPKGDDALPRHVHEFFEEGKDRDQIDRELRNRQVGELSHYRVDVTRDSGRKVPISVFAIPEQNALGSFLGSIAFFTDLEAEQATEDFNRILLESQSWKERLEGLCRWLFKKFDAELIGIAQYTDDLQYSSGVATLENDGREFEVQRRWYHLRPGLIDWIRKPGIKLEGDLPEFMEQDIASYLKKDPTIRHLVYERGMKSFMATPILEDDVYRAGMTFMSTEHDKFSQDDADLLGRLPLKNFIISALQRKEHELQAFQARLLLELTECESFEQIAEKVTSELAGFFKWDNVSIFDVAEDLGKMVLLTQAPGSQKNYLLPPDFTQPHDVGVLGRAVREKRTVYVPDVSVDPDFVRGNPDTQAELVIPIFSELYQPRRIFWLLNIEDCMESFLLDSEIIMLEELGTQIQFIVNHMIDRETYLTALTNTSDGIIITDANGAIRYANPAACRLLECMSEADLTGERIESLFKDKQLASNFMSGKLTDSHKVDLFLNGDTETTVSVLLSRLEMSERISDKYYLFKPLEFQRRLANLDAVERLVSVAANQVKTPLGLAQGMLHRLAHQSQQIDPDKITRFVDRTRSLLKKAELSYDRVAYGDSIDSVDKRINSYIHVDQLFEKLDLELSEGFSDTINLAIDGSTQPISGDRHQIRFVFESLISYLLRNLVSGHRINVGLKYEHGYVDIRVDAITDHPAAADTDSDDTDWDRVVLEASLGQSAIRRIVAQHGGEYHGPLFGGENGQLGFRVKFPTIGE